MIGARTLCIALGFAAIASAALASEDAPPLVWRTIAAADDAQTVARKLAVMPEIESAKVKSNGRLSVNYKAGGLAIGDETFRLMPEFTGARLTRFSLDTGPTCALDVEDRYNKILAALALTHETPVTPRLEKAVLDDAVLQATEQNPVELTTVRSNFQNAAVVTLEFTRKDPPSVVGSLGGTMANTQDVWRRQSYEATAAECKGTGATRLRIILSFMTRAEVGQR